MTPPLLVTPLNASYFPLLLEGKELTIEYWLDNKHDYTAKAKAVAGIDTKTGKAYIGYLVDPPKSEQIITVNWPLQEQEVNPLILYRLVALLGCFPAIRAINGPLAVGYIKGNLDLGPLVDLLREFIPKEDLEIVGNLFPTLEDLDELVGTLGHNGIAIDMIAIESELASAGTYPSDLLRTFGVRSLQEIEADQEEKDRKRVLFFRKVAPYVKLWLQAPQTADFAVDPYDQIITALDAAYEEYGLDQLALSLACGIFNGMYEAMREELDAADYATNWWEHELAFCQGIGNLIVGIAVFMEDNYRSVSKPSIATVEAALYTAAERYRKPY